MSKDVCNFLLKYIGYRGGGSTFNLGVRTKDRKSRSDTFIMFNVFEAHPKLGVELPQYPAYPLPPSLRLKFIYSEKATKFCKISTLLLSVCTVDKSKVEISQNFVAFSEYTNFNRFSTNRNWKEKQNSR